MEVNKNRWQKKKEEMRRNITNTALKLFLNQGFESTTMEQIAEETDIAKRTLYNHFSNKEEIIFEYMRQSVEERYSGLIHSILKLPDTYSRLKVLMVEINKWNEANREILKMHTSYRINNLISSNSEEIKKSTFDSTLLQIFKPGQEQGELRTDISAEALVGYFKALYTSYFLNWLYNDQKSDNISIEEIIQIFLYGTRKF